MIKDRIRSIDLKAILLFGICYIPALLYGLFCNIWLISERFDECRDNGFWFFKYVKDNNLNKNTYYVIDKNSIDRDKILDYKTVINFGSLKHYFIYLASKYHISAHVDADSPDSRVSNFLETHHLLKNKRIFLQHGITKDKISFGYYSVSRADMFICAAIPEYNFCKREFGYPDKNVVLTGFARYDGLSNNFGNTKTILIMPTWRSWLKNISEKEFCNTTFFKSYYGLLNNQHFISFIENLNVNVIFYLHSDLQKFSNLFSTKSENIEIAHYVSYGIQELLNSSNLLITDYSSVAFDFAYLKKPILYYHFDYEEYRQKQHKEGYFSYSKDGFGPVVPNIDLLIDEISKMFDANMKMENIYLNKVNDFFKYFDKNNCERIYNAIKDLSK